MKPRVLVLRTAGTNCEAETAYAFGLAGAEVQTIHVNALREDHTPLREARILAIPGGFSYGDNVASGRIFANELKNFFADELQDFCQRGGYIIGICNGFQVLVKAGLLPALNGSKHQQVTLTDNRSGLYTDRWVRVSCDRQRCAWIPEVDELELPVAHAEGRLAAPPETIAALRAAGQIPLRYHPDDNFNGSDDGIAGLCDASGRVFGLMPHPERFLRFEHHPNWTRLPRRREGDGMRFFRAAVRHAKEN